MDFWDFLAKYGFCYLSIWYYNFLDLSSREKFSLINRHNLDKFGPNPKIGSRHLASRRILKVMLSIMQTYQPHITHFLLTLSLSSLRMFYLEQKFSSDGIQNGHVGPATIHCKKMKFSIKDFFSKCDQVRSFL